MAIVEFGYYNNTYMGEVIDEEEFPRAEAKAERVINQITHGRAANYTALPECQQSAIRDAICAQVEYYAINGTDTAVNGETSNSWSVGKVHINGRSGSAANGKNGPALVCAAAVSALEQTGLMAPQVMTACEPPAVRFWG